MSIVQSNRFATDLSALNLTTDGGTVSIVSGQMVLAQTEAATHAWGRIGAAYAASVTPANGHTAYCQFMIPAFGLVSGEKMILGFGVHADARLENIFAYAANDGAGGCQLFVFDDAVGVLGAGINLAAGTTYDVRAVVNSDLSLTYSVRPTTAAGNFPGSSGSWTAVAVASTGTIPTTAFAKWGLRTEALLVNSTNLDVDEYYYTTDGVLNAAPVVNAGTDQVVTWPTNTAALNSTVSDANNDPLTLLWTVSSKPMGSNATFSDNSIEDPTLTVDASGEYTLNLNASDGIANTNDTVLITFNRVPIVNAGVNQHLYGTLMAALVGSASDDNLPTGGE